MDSQGRSSQAPYHRSLMIRRCSLYLTVISYSFSVKINVSNDLLYNGTQVAAGCLHKPRIQSYLFPRKGLILGQPLT